MSLKISGYSTALFSTWFMIEPWDILFDAGDGLTAHLLGSAGKIKQIFITHADRDHIGGLFRYHQLNARPGFPEIYFPKGSGSFPAMRDFLTLFDQGNTGSSWKGLVPHENVTIHKNLFVEPILNSHLPSTPDHPKSFGFRVMERRMKLKLAYQNWSGEQIGALRAAEGDAAVLDEVLVNLLSYSGDSPVENQSFWQDAEVLIHEATFLENGYDKPGVGKHSKLDDVLEMVATSNVKTLILSHFSTRYHEDQILEAIRSSCTSIGVDIPVYAVLPGKFYDDILKSARVV